MTNPFLAKEVDRQAICPRCGSRSAMFLGYRDGPGLSMRVDYLCRTCEQLFVRPELSELDDYYGHSDEPVCSDDSSSSSA